MIGLKGRKTVMDFHQLRVFVEVARQKNFSRAAESIFLTQPTVSAHIKALENEIGAPLFDRSQRELQLTDAGQILLRFARELLGVKEEALAAIQKKYNVVKGHLELASSSVPGVYLLPGLLKGFHSAYPEATFSVLLRDTKYVLQNIRDYSFELGFVGEAGNREGLSQVKLLEDELVLIASPETSISAGRGSGVAEGDLLPSTALDSCTHLPFIMREPGSATRKTLEKAMQQSFGDRKMLRVVAYVESQEAIKEAVKAGLGITVISKKAVQKERETGELNVYRLDDLELKRNFYLVYRKKRVLSTLSQAFLEYTIDYFSASSPT